VRAGADLVWSVCMLRKIRLEDMVSVSFDAALKEVVISRVKQIGDDWHVASAVVQPCAATYNK